MRDNPDIISISFILNLDVIYLKDILFNKIYLEQY